MEKHLFLKFCQVIAPIRSYSGQSKLPNLCFNSQRFLLKLWLCYLEFCGISLWSRHLLSSKLCSYVLQSTFQNVMVCDLSRKKIDIIIHFDRPFYALISNGFCPFPVTFTGVLTL